MLARVLKPNTAATVALLNVQTSQIRMIDSHRNKSYGGEEVQHSSAVDHHGHPDPHKLLYERLWRHKATLDWQPKPEGNWQEINGKKQAYYNKLLVGGSVAFALSLYYLLTVTMNRAGALFRPPYHLIGHEDFPGSKYDDAGTSKDE